MSKNIAILNTSAPFAKANAKDSLDLALILGSYEQKVSLFFQGDGVFQLSENQLPDAISQKDFIKTFSALPFYDIEDIYISQQCLIDRNLPEQFAIEDVQVLEQLDFAKALAVCDVTFRF